MSQQSRHGIVDRRTFVRSMAGFGGAALAATYGGAPLLAAGLSDGWATAADWRSQIGLQLFTVRDRTAQDYPGTLLKVGQIGYKEVQTTGSYGEHSADQIRAYLDAAGLRAPTTHVSPAMDDTLERTLEGYQRIGHRYTTISTRAPRSTAPRTPSSGAAATPGQRPPAPAQTLDSAQRMAEALSRAGETTQRFGIKVIYHNHTNEFAPLADSPLRPYDVLLAETDPDLVAMELDIGWAVAAGQDPLEMFRANPGRYEVWHVKDLADLASLAGLSTQAERQRAAKIVAMGDGEIDYRPIFAAAELAGMKHYYIEQDSAPQSGDSIAAAARSYQSLMRTLS